MAEINLPTPGQKPWSLNPAITAINDEVEAATAEINGRLSEQALETTIGDVSVVTYAAFERTTRTALNSAADWWCHPVATECSTPYPRTVGGGITNEGHIVVWERNHALGTVEVIDTGYTAPIDDHCAPSLLIVPGKRPVLMWTEHDDNRFLRTLVGTADGNIRGFRGAQLQSCNMGSLVSYTMNFRVSHLSDGTQDTYWSFTRVQSGPNANWGIQPFSVNGATGSITWGAFIPLFQFTNSAGYLSVTEAFGAGNQRFRVYVGYNPGGGSSHAVWYYEIDAVTGSIYRPLDSATSAVGNVSGTNLPLNEAGGTNPLLATTAGGSTRRMGPGRAGPAAPAVLTAEWATAGSGPDNATYKVTEVVALPAQAYTGFNPNGAGYVSTPHKSAWNNPVGFEIDVFFKMPASASNFYIARQFTSSTGDHLFNIRVQSDGDWAITLHGNLSTITLDTTSGPLASLWGQDVGLRMRVESGTVKRWYTTNITTPSWTLVGSAGGQAFTGGNTSLVATVGSPLIIGTDVAAQNLIPVIYRAEYKSLSGPTLAAVDFVTPGWPTWADSYTDAQGNVWTATPPGVVGTTTAYAGTRDVPVPVAPGPRVGYTSTSNYLGMGDWPKPCYVDELAVTQSAGGLDKVHRLRRVANTYQTDKVLAQQATEDGRYFRPYHPVNAAGGILSVLNVPHYSPTDFYDFLMHTELLVG